MKHLNAIEISFRLFPFFFFLILQKAHSDPREIFYAWHACSKHWILRHK